MSPPGARAWPGPAGALAAVTADAVAAARAGQAEAFEAAAARLAAADPGHVRVVLGGALRSLLEEAHPDGLDGDDVAQVLTGCVAASAWCPDVDPDVALTVLAGALGVHEYEPAALPPAAVARHAALLLAHVLTTRGRPLGPSLDAALGELARSETVEMP